GGGGRVAVRECPRGPRQHRARRARVSLQRGHEHQAGAVRGADRAEFLKVRTPRTPRRWPGRARCQRRRTDGSITSKILSTRFWIRAVSLRKWRSFPNPFIPSGSPVRALPAWALSISCPGRGLTHLGLRHSV